MWEVGENTFQAFVMTQVISVWFAFLALLVCNVAHTAAPVVFLYKQKKHKIEHQIDVNKHGHAFMRRVNLVHCNSILGKNS